MLPALPILAAVTVIALLAIAAWGLLQVRLQTVVRHRGPVRRVAVPLLLLGLLLPTVGQASPAPVPLRWRSSAVASGEGEISSGRASREGSSFGENRTSGFRLFLQVDPSGYADSPNLYAGFGNDPVNNRDPTGRDACGWFDSDEECRAKIRAGSDRNDAVVRATGRSPLRDTAKVYTLGLAAGVAAPIGAATSVPAAAAMGTAGAYSGVGIGLGLSAGIAAPLVVGTALVSGSPSDADRAAAVVAATATPLTLAGATVGAGIAGERGYFTGAAVGGGVEVVINLVALGFRALHRSSDGRLAQSAAVAEANSAQALPKKVRPGAAGALVKDGRVFTNMSYKGAGEPNLEPSVEAFMNQIPAQFRGPGHGKCVEPQNISDALRAGVDPAGAQSCVLDVRAPGNPGHLAPKPACPSCSLLNEFFGVNQ